MNIRNILNEFALEIGPERWTFYVGNKGLELNMENVKTLAPEQRATIQKIKEWFRKNPSVYKEVAEKEDGRNMDVVVKGDNVIVNNEEGVQIASFRI